MNGLRLCWRMLRRDLRGGELTLLGIALALAVAALSSVAFLASRVEGALHQQSHQLLGGDLLIASDHPLRPESLAEASKRGLRMAQSIVFPSMVSNVDATQLADIKAVSDGYPLRGALRVAEGEGADHEIHAIPARGNVWVDARLLNALGVRLGETIRVGNASMRVTKVISVEPDRGFNLISLAPRVLMNIGDVPATGLLQEGSRASWRLQIAGEANAVSRYQAWVAATLERGEKLLTVDNARPEVRNMLDRAQRFFALAAMLAVVLSAVAMTLTVNRYVRRHLDACAVLRCLGASGGRVLAVHVGEFTIFGSFVTLAGLCAGFALHELLVTRIAPLIGPLGAELPAPSWQPWGAGIGVGVVLMLGSLLPPLLRLRHVPAIRVLRRDWQGAASWPAWVASAGALAVLMFAIAGDAKLGAIVAGGFLVIALIYAAFTLALLALLKTAAGANNRFGWRLGLAGLYRRRGNTLVQSVALAIGLTALLLLGVSRTDLLSTWKHRIPSDAPNRFVLNVQPDQRKAVTDFLRARGIEAQLEPMVRGRLVAINGKPIGPRNFANEQAKRLVEREFNLSWSTHLTEGNTVLAGKWQGDSAAPQFSVEQGLADDLGLKLNDELTFEIAGHRIAARITSLRKLDWDSMRVNFFVVGTPQMLADQPASYITSFYLPAGREEVVTAAVQRFPNLTVIDVASLLRQVETATDQAARAIEAVFGFAVIAGVVVLVAVFNTTHDERSREVAILRALGARRRQLLATLFVESALLGSLAGLLAGMGASALTFALARWVFHLPYVPRAAPVAVALAAGIVLACFSGYLGLRRVASVSPVRALASDAA